MLALCLTYMLDNLCKPQRLQDDINEEAKRLLMPLSEASESAFEQHGDIYEGKAKDLLLAARIKALSTAAAAVGASEHGLAAAQRLAMPLNVPSSADIDKSRKSYQDGSNLRGIVLGDPAKYAPSTSCAYVQTRCCGHFGADYFS